MSDRLSTHGPRSGWFYPFELFEHLATPRTVARNFRALFQTPSLTRANVVNLTTTGGQTGTLVLPKAGTYAIHCKIHSRMHGTIVVK